VPRAEIPLALGGLGDLIEPALAEFADELREPQWRALAVVVGLEAPPDGAPDHLALPRAFLAFLRALAARSPALVAIDDAQWLDPASQRIVAFAARGLGDAPVAILATERGNAADPFDLRHAFDDRFTEIRVGPLSIGALHHLIRTRLGVRIPRPTVARVHAASGGNPMFALEFARVAASAGRPLPVPSSLEKLVRDRIARLPSEVLPLLAAVALVERPTPSLLRAVIDDADALLDAASAAGAVTLGPEGIVRFTHPLLASAAYAAVQPGASHALHERLAAESRDPEEQARHVALSTFEPDADAALLLDEAAARAASRGAPDAAAGLARHAMRLTPRDDVDGREERALGTATYLTDAGQMASAEVVLEDLLAGTVSGDRRARALLLDVCLVEVDLEKSRTLLEEAREHAGEDLATRIRLLLCLGTYPFHRGGLAAAEAIVREALAAAEELGDPVLLSAALTSVADMTSLGGNPEPSLLHRATVLLNDRPPLRGFPSPRMVLARQRRWAGDLLGARALLEAELAAARGRGHDHLTALVLVSLVDVEWAAGNWDVAERHVDEHSQLVFDAENRGGETHMLWRRGVLAASRGHVEEARLLAVEAIARGEDLHPSWLVLRGRWLLGLVALSLDNPVDAWNELRAVADCLARCEKLMPRDVPLVPDVVEAMVAAGHLEAAATTVASLDAHARAGEQRWASPAAARCRALLLLARSEPEAALMAAEEAASEFESAGFPLDYGRSLLVAGDALRRLGERRRAAEKLEQAKETFAQLGGSGSRERRGICVERTRARGATVS
jgi:tetratricopeptide (TPR) repeat protein